MTAQARTASTATGSISHTRSSTTTAGSPTPRSIPTSAPPTVAAFLERALAFYAGHGIVPKRLMTDNAWIYVRSRQVRELLARNGTRHLTTKPYRPRTNGKVERFHQTMAREWAYGLVYRTHRERTTALPHWLDLQPDTATQLARRATPNQPRSQPTWAGQLAAQSVSPRSRARTMACARVRTPSFS